MNAALVLAAVVLVTNRAPSTPTTDAEALASVDAAQAEGSAAVQEAMTRFAESRGDPSELLLMEGAVTAALASLDEIGPRPCYQEWWSTVRTAYVMLAEGIRGIRAGNAAVMQMGFLGADMLVRLAAGMRPKLTCA
jgi:hypothetical protein